MCQTLPSTPDALQRARYLTSVDTLERLPPDTGREIAFAGRSNAGKSTLLNQVCRQRLARTSKTPGCTRTIVCFDLGEGRRLIDLPGWGYAAVSKRLQARWSELLPQYLRSRRSLRGVVLAVDARRGLLAEEWTFIAWARAGGLPLELALTKSDKLRQRERSVRTAELRDRLRGAEMRWRFVSTRTGQGVEDLRQRLAELLSA